MLLIQGNLPAVETETGYNYVFVVGYPYQKQALKITHDGEVYTPSCFQLGNNFCIAEVLDDAGNPVNLQVGDQVKATGAMNHVIPYMSLSFDRSTGIATVTSPRYKYVYASVNSLLTRRGWGIWKNAKADGTFWFNTHDAFPDPYEQLYYEIDYENPYTGNDAYIRAVVP
jgi:hypothetical protein